MLVPFDKVYPERSQMSSGQALLQSGIAPPSPSGFGGQAGYSDRVYTEASRSAQDKFIKASSENELAFFFFTSHRAQRKAKDVAENAFELIKDDKAGRRWLYEKLGLELDDSVK